MKILVRTTIFLGICLFLIACGQSITATTSPVPSLTATATATITPLLTNTSTPTITPALRPEYVPPTLIPTIDPTLVPELLGKAFAVQTMEGVNGHKIRQITGWDYGFGGGFLYTSCMGYIWLDANHLLVYPATGQVALPEGWSPTKFNVVRRPVVINLENGHVWLPPVKAPTSPEICDIVEWSSELGVLILPEDYDGRSTVSTYTFDGRKLASYTGSPMDVSPSGTKIFLDDNTLIDLRTNRSITLTGSLEYYSEEFYDLFWTSDETRIYRCCYFYADLKAGTSHSSASSDFQEINDNHRDPWGLVYLGGWIQNDTYFLPDWNWLDDGDIRYLPMLDPAQKIVIEVRAKVGIPEDWSCTDIDVSPDGKYVWMTGFGDSYLVDLIAFKAQYYPSKRYSSVYWSPNSKFALLESYDSSNMNKQYDLLSLSNKKLQTLAINDLFDVWSGWWHPTDHVFAYVSEASQKLVLFNVQTMRAQELTSPVTFKSFTWSPNEDRLALVADDGSVWQADYPSLENLEQLTPSLPGVSAVDWSPGGNFISFISSSDIYIGETTR